MDTQNITPTVGAAIHALVQHIVDDWNKTERRLTEDYNRDNPDGEPAAPELYCMAEAMSFFASGHSFDDGSLLADYIREAILTAVNSVEAIDPWPELTVGELRFLVGNRKPPLGDLWRLLCNDLSEPSQPLTLVEKFIAARHRVWLEKDADKRRVKLAKAKAIVAAMEGRAA